MGVGGSIFLTEIPLSVRIASVCQSITIGHLSTISINRTLGNVATNVDFLETPDRRYRDALAAFLRVSVAVFTR